MGKVRGHTLLVDGWLHATLLRLGARNAGAATCAERWCGNVRVALLLLVFDFWILYFWILDCGFGDLGFWYFVKLRFTIFDFGVFDAFCNFMDVWFLYFGFLFWISDFRILWIVFESWYFCWILDVLIWSLGCGMCGCLIFLYIVFDDVEYLDACFWDSLLVWISVFWFGKQCIVDERRPAEEGNWNDKRCRCCGALQKPLFMRVFTNGGGMACSKIADLKLGFVNTDCSCPKPDVPAKHVYFRSWKASALNVTTWYFKIRLVNVACTTKATFRGQSSALPRVPNNVSDVCGPRCVSCAPGPIFAQSRVYV